MNVAEGIMLGILAGFSAYDLKFRRISVQAVGLLGAGAILYRIVTGAGILELVAGLLPGRVLVILAICTRESSGMGDGLMLCAIGLFTGMKQAVAVLGMALVLASVLSMVLLILRKAGRKTEVPFLPCLWAGYLLQCIW